MPLFVGVVDQETPACERDDAFSKQNQKHRQFDAFVNPNMQRTGAAARGGSSGGWGIMGRHGGDVADTGAQAPTQTKGNLVRTKNGLWVKAPSRGFVSSDDVVKGAAKLTRRVKKRNEFGEIVHEPEAAPTDHGHYRGGRDDSTSRRRSDSRDGARRAERSRSGGHHRSKRSRYRSRSRDRDRRGDSRDRRRTWSRRSRSGSADEPRSSRSRDRVRRGDSRDRRRTSSRRSRSGSADEPRRRETSSRKHRSRRRSHSDSRGRSPRRRRSRSYS